MIYLELENGPGVTYMVMWSSLPKPWKVRRHYNQPHLLGKQAQNGHAAS